MHYNSAIMGAIASQIASLTIVYSTVYSGADQRKYQSSTSLAFVRGIHRLPVNSPHQGPVKRKMFPFDDVIMGVIFLQNTHSKHHWGVCVLIQAITRMSLYLMCVRYLSYIPRHQPHWCIQYHHVIMTPKFTCTIVYVKHKIWTSV